MSENIEQQIKQAQAQIVNTAQEQAQTVAQYIGQQAEQASATFQSGAQSATQQAVSNIETASTEAVKSIQQASDQAGETMLAKVNSLITALNESIKDANGQRATAEAEIRKADKAKAEAKAEREKLETEREKSERATAFLSMARDVEVQRATEEMDFARREKEMMTQLKNERAAMEDAADRRDQAIQLGIQAYVPELQEKLDEIAEQDGEDD